jgi:hypothetical protein
MKAQVFSDLIKETKSRNLWIFFIISLVLHVFIIRLLVDMPVIKRKPTLNFDKTYRWSKGVAVPSTSFKRNQSSSVSDVKNLSKFSRRPKKIQSSGGQFLIHERKMGNIQGTIRNNKNISLPGVKITAVNKRAKIFYTTVSDNDGRYTLTEISPGIYRVIVVTPGYRGLLRQGILIRDNDTRVLNLALTSVGRMVTTNTHSQPNPESGRIEKAKISYPWVITETDKHRIQEVVDGLVSLMPIAIDEKGVAEEQVSLKTFNLQKLLAEVVYKFSLFKKTVMYIIKFFRTIVIKIIESLMDSRP